MKVVFHKKKVALFLAILGFLLIVYSLWEPHWVKISKVEIRSADIPDSFDGTTMAFIADIHFGHYFSGPRLSEIVDRINDLNPDIIFLGGDYIFYEFHFIEPVFKELGRLRCKMGVYGVLGNHDHWGSAYHTKWSMAKYGIVCCDNCSVWVKSGHDSIKVGGVGDLWYDTQVPENTLNGLKKTDFTILLSHHPDYLENIRSDLIDLTLSGHTHGGQVAFFGWSPVLPSLYGQKYRYGLIKQGTTQSYITSGIGTVSPPVRFFCRPEIVLFQLKKEKL